MRQFKRLDLRSEIAFLEAHQPIDVAGRSLAQQRHQNAGPAVTGPVRILAVGIDDLFQESLDSRQLLPCRRTDPSHAARLILSDPGLNLLFQQNGKQVTSRLAVG